MFSGFIVFLCTSDMFCIAFCYLFHKATALLLSIKYIPKRRKCVIQCSDLRGKLLGYFCCNVASSCFALLASLSHGVLLTESCLDKWVLLCCHAKLKAFSVWIFFFFCADHFSLQVVNMFDISFRVRPVRFFNKHFY